MQSRRPERQFHNNDHSISLLPEKSQIRFSAVSPSGEQYTLIEMINLLGLFLL